jgi:hypothetical protein
MHHGRRSTPGPTDKAATGPKPPQAQRAPMPTPKRPPARRDDGVQEEIGATSGKSHERVLRDALDDPDRAHQAAKASERELAQDKQPDAEVARRTKSEPM